VEEELFERLLQEIQKNQSVHVLDQYEKVLKKHLPNEVRDMYVQYVKKESTRTSDRKSYKYLISYLKKITKYPDGKKIARDIAECWKQDYKRRPAMMDELRKAGF
jgi:FMN phosphatase YigB (HAD superfamily)